MRLAQNLFWDNRQPLSQLYTRLSNRGKELIQQWNNKPLLCSMRAAALLLDIDSYHKLHSDPSSLTARQILALRVTERDGKVLVGDEGGNPLVVDHEDFAIFQALVLEMVIPVRRAALDANKPFCKFLEVADLLDFPGVARIQAGSEHRIDLEKLSAKDHHLLYTRLLKRGKTSSVVAAYAKRLTIDGFTLLARLAQPPSQPDQLLAGIRTWWQYLDPQYYRGAPSGPSPLPLNLVLTFCAEPLETAMSAGSSGITEPMFRLFRNLAHLADPRVLSNTLATNYPHFRAGVWTIDAAAREKFATQVMQETEFKRQFVNGPSAQSFLKMIKDGGTDHLFEVLASQAGASRRKELVARRRTLLEDELRNLVEQACPGAGDTLARRRSVLTKWRETLEKRLIGASEQQVNKLSHVLRTLFHVAPDSLDPIPLSIHTRNVSDEALTKFTLQQLHHWKRRNEDENVAVLSDLECLGLESKASYGQLLGFIVDSVNPSPIIIWLRRHFGHIRQRQEADRSRRFLAMRIANSLLPFNGSHQPTRTAPGAISAAGPLHRTHKDTQSELELYESGGTGTYELQLSPHMRFFIDPFLKALGTLAEATVAHERPAQPGDDELLALIAKFPRFAQKGDTT